MSYCSHLCRSIVSLTLVMALGIGQAFAAPVIPPKLPKHPGEVPIEEALIILLEHIATQQDALVAIQRELVKRPGFPPDDGGDGEEEKARWIEDWLAAEGLPPAERIDCPDERVSSKVRPSLILRQPAAKLDRPTLWVVAYLDNSTVGDEAAWSGSPTSLRVDGDFMYGKGVQDNNDGIAAALLALRALHRYEIVAPMNLGVLLVSDEKQGNKHGFDYLARKRPGLFSDLDQFLVLSYGVETGDVIETGEKGIAWFKITVRGKQAHAAFPHQGKNALIAGAELVTALSALHQAFPALNPIFDPPYSTFTPTRPEAPAASTNQVPGYFAFHLDVRLLPEYHFEEVRKEVEKIADAVLARHGLEIEVTRILVRQSSPVMPPDAPIVLATERAIEAQLQRRPILAGVGGVTIAAELRRMGFPAVVWRMAPFQEHSANESMSISSNLAEAAIIVRLLLDRELATAAPTARRDMPPANGTTP